MRKSIFVATILLTFVATLFAQPCTWNGSQFVDADGNECPNSLTTVVPFLTIAPDARSGAMGDMGIAISPDANRIHYNAASLAFVENDFSLSVTYSPWLRNLQINDIYLAYLAGFRKLDDLQTIGFSLKYFSLGEINFTDDQGEPIGVGQPNELSASVAYARKLAPNFSAGITGKFIYSSLASQQRIGTTEIYPGVSGAADISFRYNGELSNGAGLSAGLTMSNLGAKISYTRDSEKFFLPATFGLGAAYITNLDDYNQVTFGLDINKLMVPTPYFSDHPDFDTDNNDIPDYREKSLLGGMFGSFTDAPGGFNEEMKELMFSVGAEYLYDQQFALRAGYFYENPLKGNRQYFTLGVGVKYNVFNINLSYLVPTNNQNNPLGNTLRFTLLFDFANRVES